MFILQNLMDTGTIKCAMLVLPLYYFTMTNYFWAFIEGKILYYIMLIALVNTYPKTIFTSVRQCVPESDQTALYYLFYILFDGGFCFVKIYPMSNLNKQIFIMNLKHFNFILFS